MTNLPLRGSNLAGGDNLWSKWPAGGPVANSTYRFVTTRDVDYLMSKGANFFRLLFGWETMQRSPRAALDPTFLAAFKAVVDYATGKGATVLLDVHGGDAAAEGGAYYGTKIPGSYAGTLVSDALVDLWSKLAAVFKGNARVAFGLMNEPNAETTADWFACAQKCIAAIRAAGSTNLVCCPGANWTNSVNWVSNGNAAAALGIVDPANSLAFQVHEYLDANGGGGGTDIVSATIGADRMKDAIAWARANGKKLVLAEVGFQAANPLAAQAATNLFALLSASSDVVLGWAWWAYGPLAWWSSYQFTLCPSADYATDSPQMKLIAPYLAAPAAPPVDPTIALKAQIADLAAQLQAAQDANAKLLSTIATSGADLAIAQDALAASNAQVSKLRSALAAISSSATSALG